MKERQSRGSLVAAALQGAWRPSPPAPRLSPAELNEIAPLLIGRGAGGLGWWAVRGSPLAESAGAQRLKQAYGLNLLRASVHRRELKHVVRILRSAGVEPLPVKGWSMGRLYPDEGLRPFGDIDLWVGPEQYGMASAALAGRECPGDLQVDLQRRLLDLRDHPAEELRRRARQATLEDLEEVRVLGPEDHLRLLCLHLLRHGASRPSWLCDVGLLLESLPPGFDWEYCLSGERRRSEAVILVLALAHALLGASLEEAPQQVKDVSLPTWLLPAVLRHWGGPYRILPRVMTLWASPLEMVAALGERWPNPIEATVLLNAPFNQMPRLPFQLGFLLVRGALFLRRAGRVNAVLGPAPGEEAGVGVDGAEGAPGERAADDDGTRGAPPIGSWLAPRPQHVDRTEVLPWRSR